MIISKRSSCKMKQKQQKKSTTKNQNHPKSDSNVNTSSELITSRQIVRKN